MSVAKTRYKLAVGYGAVGLGVIIGVLIVRWLGAPAWAQFGFGYWIWISTCRHMRVSDVLRAMGNLQAAETTVRFNLR